MNDLRVINTGLTGPVNKDILDSVMGQLSDGKWENTPAMVKYWRNTRIDERDGKIVILVSDNYNSGFRGKDETWIRSWFAGKIKDIVYEEMGEVGGFRWNRKDTTELDYLSRGSGSKPITVSNAYQAYEILKGRNLKNRYEEPNRAPSSEVNRAPSSEVTPEAAVDRMLDDDEPQHSYG
jgi:hypothetical protein